MISDIVANVKINIKAPIDKVWEALVKPEIIKEYFFGTETTTDWKPGSPITFKGTWEGKPYEDKGTVLEIKKNKKIKYNYWSSMAGIEDEPDNYVDISYELSGEDDDVTLSITQENILNEKMKDHSEANWQKVLADLKDVVEEKAVSFI